MSIDLPTYTLDERRPRYDQPVRAIAKDHLGEYTLPFACRYVRGAWVNVENGSVMTANIMAWRPFHAIDMHPKRRPGRLALIEPKMQVRS